MLVNSENNNLKYELEYFKSVVESSDNLSEISYKLHNNNLYGNRQTIKKYISLYTLDTSHFHKKKKCFGKRVKKEMSEILVENSTYDTTNLKDRLYKEGLKERVCEECGQGEIWRGKKMSLILDHINGINTDNRLENLRIVCPNCNATLETHCRGYSKLNKEKVIKEKVIIDKKVSNKKRSLKQRTTERPEYEILVEDVKELGFLKTGTKYNVSDNSIRKWLKHYINNEGKENVLNIKI